MPSNATVQGERFVVAAMAAAAQNSTRACMDSLGNGNTFDDLFSAAFRPEHREVLRVCISSKLKIRSSRQRGR